MSDIRSVTQELQAKPFTPYGACRQVWEHQGFEALIVGPAGTGKTRSDLEWLHLGNMKYPKCRSLIVRKTRAELTETALVELEDHVFAPNWRDWFGNAKREQRSSYHYPNGSILVAAGMDDPRKILSSEYDRILVVEAVQLTQEDYELLTTRCRATNTAYQKIVCETNPDVPAHWLLQRAMAGKMAMFKSTHKDNPKYWDHAKGEYTAAGLFYINNVLSNLTGNRRRRLLLGEWCADDRAVFDYEVLERHLRLCRPPTFCLKIGHALQGSARDQSISEGKIEDITITKMALPSSTQEMQHRLLWWGALKLDPVTDLLRPPQDRVYVLSADISGGNGASNSVIGIVDRNTRKKVGEWVSATISPGGLARVLAMLGYWVGGLRGQGHLIWEANYPGPYFGRQLARVLCYPDLYRRDSRPDTASGAAGDRLGWWNDRTTKRDAVEGLRDAWARDEFSDPSEMAIQEAMQWLRWPTGDMGPGHLQDESTDAKATHGDRCIVDMMLVMGMNIDLPTPKAPMPTDPIVVHRLRAAGKLPWPEKDEDGFESDEMIEY